MVKEVKKTTKSKKAKASIPESGKAYIFAGFNNTLITLTDSEGNALFSTSAGASGFKGSRKSTPYAAASASESVAKKALQAGLGEVSVVVKGPGYGRISAIKALKGAGLHILSISDVTPTPHNGCRPKKTRRI